MKRVKRVKRIISAITAAALCAAAVPAAVAGGYYSDVDDNAYYATAVERLTDFGVMRGYEDGTFRPENTLTRAEAAALICMAQNQRPEWSVKDNDLAIIKDVNGKSSAVKSFSVSGIPGFADVGRDHWAYLYILLAISNSKRILQGDGSRWFYPENTVTYREFLKMCVGLLGYYQSADSKGGYPDGYIAQAQELGLTDGLGDVDYASELIRSDAAVILENTLETPVAVTSWNAQDGETTDVPQDGEGGRYITPLILYFNIYKITASAAGSETKPEPPYVSDEAYAEAAADLKAMKIIDDDFEPDKEVTRGEFAKYARAMLYPSDEEVTSEYRGELTDVDGGRNDIYFMLNRGWMEIKSELLFGTDDKITFNDAAYTLGRMTVKYGSYFGEDAYKNGSEAVENGITKGIENAENKRPGDTVTGREAAIMLHNCLDMPTTLDKGVEGNTFRNKLNGGGGIKRIEDKGEKVAEFKDVTVPVYSSFTQLGAKLCSINVPSHKDIIVSLDDPPEYVDYCVDVISKAPSRYGDSFTAMEGHMPGIWQAPGDIIAYDNTETSDAAGDSEYTLYITSSSAPVTVSGTVYVRDAVTE